MVSAKNSNIHVFQNSKSIFIFHFWTFIFVHFSLFKNNLGFSKNVTFYIINSQNYLKRTIPLVKEINTFWLKNFILVNCNVFRNISNDFVFLFNIIVSFSTKCFNYEFIILIRIFGIAFFTSWILVFKFFK